MVNELILVVDDGKDNRDFVVEHVLKPNGFRHLTARDGQEGLQVAVQKKPDLILLDLQMPRMDGMTVLRHLRDKQLDIPVILMTFHGSEEIAIEVHRLGVRDYIKKPYYPEEMLEAIERSLYVTRLRKEKEVLMERVLQANRQLQRRVQELNILYKVGKSVTSTFDLTRLLPNIVDSAAQLTGSETAYLYLVEENRLICRAQKENREQQSISSSVEVRDPVAIHVIKNRQAIALAPEQLKALPEAHRPLSVAYAPLILHNRVLGVLGVANFEPGSSCFTQNDSNLLSALSDYASIAIENAHNYTAMLSSKERMRDTFERFVPPSVVQQALAPEGIELGGHRQEISVLFADIRGYSTWSENAAPEKVIDTLNHYLSLAAGVILGWEGTLDKYMGDGLMAIFNAPKEQPDHVHRVADAALAVMRAAQEVNLQHGYQLSYSIGVHVGEAVVGYIGTQRALNYTAIGDTVNLAKRLQENAQPGQILIEESIVKRLSNRIKVRPLGEIKVKGRQQPAVAYELLDVY